MKLKSKKHKTGLKSFLGKAFQTFVILLTGH
jgi:hypothetical protein